MPDPPDVPAPALDLAQRLATLPGVVAVTLGGSYANGRATASSDVDLGLYYDAATFDLTPLDELCRDVDDAPGAHATPPGAWGRWVDGGAWLTLKGQRVDVLYRRVDRVELSVEDALAGRVTLHTQVGHPHGIHGHHYAAELALGVVLHDPTGRLAELQARLKPYPSALRDALQRQYAWQGSFWLEGARSSLAREDVNHVQGCAYQAVMAMVQTICARGERWLTNEKGAVSVTATVPGAPTAFERRVREALLTLDLDALLTLALEVRAEVERPDDEATLASPSGQEGDA
ncbi:nucleotidyltransferase domain-containing protein [Deinococcus pimensis]|uniref:nucleotidyltransferase domain-containing protein n=1 Tax=Deinococcus pimensis TaxID=309888 RepID=UPI0004B85088|nr:nucleotidyltransferase domain-containing protein [Deinococcus pimensis]